MNVRPAGREACNCASPYNSILERLDAMEAEILAVQATANSAMGVANAQAGAAASSASAAAASATAAGNAAISAAADASDALTQATASAGSADDAADSAADALTALQTIEGTIASVLASDIGGKVDKLTTAGFYLYMHNGSTQGEVQPVVAPTAATIPIRDSDGRMQAADPASGATDKTLVTANWVSQTGAGAPNNLMHTTGNETADGDKTFTGITTATIFRLVNTGGNGYKILYRFKNNHAQTLLITGGRTIIVAQVLNTGGYKKVLATSGRDYTTTSWLWVVTDALTGDNYLVCRGLYSATMNIHVINSFLYGSVYPYQDDIELINQTTNDPTTDTRWSSVTEVGNYD